MTDLKNSEWQIEVLKKEVELGKFKAAVFDFDGTISLIREGWQQVMIPYFIEEVMKAPMAKDMESISTLVRDFVDFLTGKQTIYQCIRLAEEIQALGGKAEEPIVYKDEYHKRLLERIDYRIKGLKEGKIKPVDAVVPGSFELLNMLKKHGLVLYLASGTDEKYVLDEAELIGVTKLFDGGIYGAKDEYKLFSKAMVIQNILTTHNLSGHELIGFGDGYVEIENVKSVKGFAVGVASDEVNRCGVDEWKRNRLTCAGADVIIADYSQINKIEGYIFP